MENTKYGRRREGRWTPIRTKAQDTRANPNSWETHLVRKRWDIGLLRALSPRIMMMMMTGFGPINPINTTMGILTLHRFYCVDLWLFAWCTYHPMGALLKPRL